MVLQFGQYPEYLRRFHALLVVGVDKGGYDGAVTVDNKCSRDGQLEGVNPY
jgi:hypothetical protein